MNAMITDSAALSAARPLEMIAYLRSMGWKQVKENPGLWSIWTRGDGCGDEYEVTVPLNHAFRDFPSRVSDVLRVLEASESRSQLEILRDLLVTGFDVIRLRLVDSDLADATVPLEEGATFVQKARELLLCAASAAVQPRMYYPRRKPPQATEYLRRVRLGQTEAGSFVVTLLSPVSPSLVDRQGRTNGLGDPFERQVTRTLAIALHSAKQAAASGKVDSFVGAVNKGVSANLCDALVGMGVFSEAKRTLDISLAWSRGRPVPPDASVPDRIVLTEDVFPIMQAAATYLKEISPREKFEVQGVVVKLERPEGESTGTVTIHGLIDERARKVVVDLSGEDYLQAIQAHEDRCLVSCRGVLTREGRVFRLRYPYDFAVEQAEVE